MLKASIPSVSGAGCIVVSCCGVGGCCGVDGGVNGCGSGVGCGCGSGLSGCGVVVCGIMASVVTGAGGGADSSTAEFLLGFLRYLSLNCSFFRPVFYPTHGFCF